MLRRPARLSSRRHVASRQANRRWSSPSTMTPTLQGKQRRYRSPGFNAICCVSSPFRIACTQPSLRNTTTIPTPHAFSQPPEVAHRTAWSIPCVRFHIARVQSGHMRRFQPKTSFIFVNRHRFFVNFVWQPILATGPGMRTLSLDAAADFCAHIVGLLDARRCGHHGAATYTGSSGHSICPCANTADCVRQTFSSPIHCASPIGGYTCAPCTVTKTQGAIKAICTVEGFFGDIL